MGKNLVHRIELRSIIRSWYSISIVIVWFCKNQSSIMFKSKAILKIYGDIGVWWDVHDVLVLISNLVVQWLSRHSVMHVRLYGIVWNWLIIKRLRGFILNIVYTWLTFPSQLFRTNLWLTVSMMASHCDILRRRLYKAASMFHTTILSLQLNLWIINILSSFLIKLLLMDVNW